MSLRRKIYWTDGSTINMASMDGSNSKVLHQNQRDPVGECESSGQHADGDLLVSHIPYQRRCLCVVTTSYGSRRMSTWMWTPRYIDQAALVRVCLRLSEGQVRQLSTEPVDLVPVDA